MLICVSTSPPGDSRALPSWRTTTQQCWGLRPLGAAHHLPQHAAPPHLWPPTADACRAHTGALLTTQDPHLHALRPPCRAVLRNISSRLDFSLNVITVHHFENILFGQTTCWFRVDAPKGNWAGEGPGQGSRGRGPAGFSAAALGVQPASVTNQQVLSPP